MGVVKYNPTAPAPELTTPQTILEPRESTFTTLVPESRIVSLLKYAEGFPWTVNYYGQILSKSNTLETFDPTTLNLSAPYYHIKSLILQVSSPLTSSYDQATGVTTLEGTATASYGITPNIGDVFIANVDTGEDAIFIISTVTRKTHHKNTLYEVSYHLLSYTNSNLAMVQTLDARVQDIYYYNKDSNHYNRDALVTPEVKEANDRLQTFLVRSKDYYFKRFFSKAGGAVFVPHANYKIYDPGMTDFILATVEIDYNFAPLSLFHHSNDQNLETPSILTAIQTRTKEYLASLCKTYYAMPSNYLANKARLGSMYLVGIDYIVYPIEVTQKYVVDSYPKRVLPEDTITLNTLTNYTGYNRSIELTTGIVPLHSTIAADNSYIVSEAFYAYCADQSPTNAAAMSYTELLIYKYLHEQAITKKDLVVAIEDYDKWDSLKQYYLLPIYWQLVRAYL